MTGAAPKQRVGIRRLSSSARYSLALLTAASYVSIQLIQTSDQDGSTRELLTWASGLLVAAGLLPVHRLWAQFGPTSFRHSPRRELRPIESQFEPLRPIESQPELLRPIESQPEPLRPMQSLSALLRPMQRPMPTQPELPLPQEMSLQNPELPASGSGHGQVQTAAVR